MAIADLCSLTELISNFQTINQGCNCLLSRPVFSPTLFKDNSTIMTHQPNIFLMTLTVCQIPRLYHQWHDGGPDEGTSKIRKYFAIGAQFK